jgi:serine beta-lactamase-like protein LACTB
MRKLAALAGLVIGVAAVVVAFVAGGTLPLDSAPVAAAPWSRYKANQIGPCLRSAVDKYPGLSFAAGRGGQVDLGGGAGWRDIARGEASTAHTRYRLYGLSEPVTAAALFRLCEEGRLSLDQPVGELVPGLSRALAAITVRQVASHLSGIRGYHRGESLDLGRTRCNNVEEALRPFINDPLMADPGAEFIHSAFNYVLLSRVIERAAGIPFTEYVKLAVLQPAGMKETGFQGGTVGGVPLSVFYERAIFGRVQVARPVDNSCKCGAGALISTPTDMVAFGLALLDGKLLSRSSMAMMLKPAAGGSDSDTGHGIGWELRRDSSGRLYASREGAGIGARGAIVLYPRERVVAVVLGNLNGDGLLDEAEGLADLVMK